MYGDAKILHKFRGQYIEIEPKGTLHLEFKKSGSYYTWTRAKTYVNNILLGKMWINVQGEEMIKNHTTNDVCQLKFWPSNFFSTDPVNKVTGIIKDSSNKAKYVLDGICTERLEYAPVPNSQTVKNVDEIKKLTHGKFQLIWEKSKYP